MYPLAHVPALELTDLQERRRRQARERVQRYRKRSSYERRQYESERKRLACQKQSDSLHLLTAHEQDRKRTAQVTTLTSVQNR